MTIKDIMNDDELFNSLDEDILSDYDINEDAEVIYEVWALGYDINNEITDHEVLLMQTGNPEAAVDFAKALKPEDAIIDVLDSYDITTITVEVESVVSDGEDWINAGTIYSRVVWEAEEDEVIIALLPDDYTLFEDNSILVKREALKGFNKNDKVMITFSDDPDQFPIVYRIMSTVACTDGDYYRCELDF